MDFDKKALEEILAAQKIVSLAITMSDGRPHNTPVWITNSGTNLYVLTRSTRTKARIASKASECMIAFKWAAIRGKIHIINHEDPSFNGIRDLMDKRYTDENGYLEYKKHWDTAIEIIPYKLYRF